MSASILVAEHYPTARASLADLLRLDGYRVLEGADEPSAFRRLNEVTCVHAVLCDLEMGGWHSIIKHALMLSPTTHIVGMARHGQVPMELDLKTLGVRDYFFKPVSYPDFRQNISQAFEGAHRLTNTFHLPVTRAVCNACSGRTMEQYKLSRFRLWHGWFTHSADSCPHGAAVGFEVTRFELPSFTMDV